MEAVKGIYHPDKLDAESFIANFTIRLKEFASVIDNLNKQKKKPLQHFLITGKRGMGKSTLLRRIYLEAKKKPLSDKIIAVRLGSEQYKLSRLYKLWEEVIKILSLEDNSLNEKREQFAHDKNYEEHIIHIIVDYLQEQNRTLLLLIDNFDQFIDKLTPKEQHAFREILIQYPIQIIGNTVFYNEHFFKYEKAFFDFFKPIHLRNLDKDEAEEFIKQLAANEELENFDEILKSQKGKIDTLRILSGGVPRTLVILLSILSKRNTGEAIDYLNEMLEQVTPLYQDRMKALSSQQQEIMHHLAIHWDRASAKELAAETRIPSKSISAQLSQLEDSGYINKISTNKRNHLYEIDERFFNIWLLMSESSAYDAKRVIWLTKWLDMFYDAEELEDFASYCNGNLKSIKPINRFLIVQALSESKKLSSGFKDKLVDQTLELFSSIPEVISWIKNYNSKRTKEITDRSDELKHAFNTNDYDGMLSALDHLSTDIDKASTYRAMGLIYQKKKNNYPKALQYYLMALKEGSVECFTEIGELYFSEKDYDNAVKYYNMGIAHGNIKAMFSLGFYYASVKEDYDNAEKYFLMAAEKGNVLAMMGLGFIYSNYKNDFDNAEKYFLMAAEKGDEFSMLGLGIIYSRRKNDFGNAEKYFLMAAEKGNESAKNGLANLYYQKNDVSKKTETLKITETLLENSNLDFLITRLKILFWNEKIKEAYSLLEELLEKYPQDAETTRIISEALIYFLVFKQKQFLYKLFNEKNKSLKDQFKPVYFALLHEMKNELPDEYLKMTEEISEPVNDLLKLIQKERQRLSVK